MNNNKFMPIKNIVINGGGPIIFNAYGALKQAHLSNMWSHETVESYYGTSAGSILALMLALQYSWEDLDDFIIKRPWQHVWKFSLLNVYEYFTNKGIYGKDMFIDFLGPLFKGKDLEVSVSLKDFYEATKKTLYIYAVDLATFELVEFSHLSHPEMPVLEAVRASSALPILFQPVEYQGHLYTDGGFLLNYPLSKCKADPETILGVRNVFTIRKISQVDSVLTKPGIPWFLSRNLGFDFIVFNNSTGSGINQEHLPWLESALTDNLGWLYVGYTDL